MSFPTAALGKVSSYVRGITFKPTDKVPVGTSDSVVCMRTANIQAELDERDLIAVPKRFVARSEQYLRPGDILVSSANSWNLVGKCCAVPRLALQSTAGGFISILRPDPNHVDDRYLYRWLSSPAVQHVARQCARQTTNIANLSAERFLSLRVPVPALPEQRRIAAILDKADALHRKREESIRLTGELVRSTFLEMFGDPVRNPKGWRIETLGVIAPGKGFVVDGPFGSSMKPNCYVESGVRVIRNVNIRSGRFDASQLKYVTEQKYLEVQRSSVKPGDLLISTKGTIGDACVLPCLDGPSVLSATGTARVRFPLEADISADFALAQIRMPEYERVFASIQAGSNQKYLNLAGIRRMPLIVPPSRDQERFLNLQARLEHLGVQHGVGAADIKDLFQSLLHCAFRGEL